MNPGKSSILGIRGPILHCLREPDVNTALDSDFGSHGVEYLEDGLMLVQNGHVEQLGPAEQLMDSLSSDIPVNYYPDQLIVPGFVDTHIHYSQTDIIASPGEQLLDWLNNYAFPAEQAFADRAVAEEAAEFFVRELLRNGTTTAMVLGTVHPHSADALFEAAQRHNLRLTAGKVMMDRHCPPELQDTPESAYTETLAHIEKWHGQGRLSYAITPRFAPTSSDEQLRLAGQLASRFPDVYVHTHVAENRKEVEWVKELFPAARSYLDVYQQHDLLRERSILAHCIYLDKTDRQAMQSTGATMAFCPTSNLFLGSGLFDVEAAQAEGIRFGLGSDVGGGTSFSMLQTVNEGYKVARMAGQHLPTLAAFYRITLGGAHALLIDDKIGNFARGKEADFLVLDPAATPLIKRRLARATELEEKLFALFMLGDDRVINESWVMGERKYKA